MDGIFLRKKFNIGAFLLAFFGVFSVGFFAFLKFVKQETEGAVFIFLFLGIGICLCALLIWFWNFGAYVHIDERSIKAKYHFFGRIDCELSSVEAALAQGSFLTIQTTDGKIYRIGGLYNAYELCAIIRRHIAFSETADPETLLERLNALKSKRKKGIIGILLLIPMLSINLFIAGALTGNRHLYEFTQADWNVAKIFGVAEAITVAALFYVAIKAGKTEIPIEILGYTVARRIIESTELLPGNAVRVFSGEDYTGRITVYKYPGDDSGYMYFELLDKNYNLVKTHETDVIEDISEVIDEYAEYIDITDKFLQ